MASLTDEDFLGLALQLATQGASLVSPNPLVGSVVVRNGEVVGRGYHRYQDVKHAEVWALEDAGPLAKGSTVYVNLEPCCHYGDGKRTPPCVDALLDAGVRRVVASIIDPNPKVNGQGFARLREAGVDVDSGGLEREAIRVNEKYLKYVTTSRPFVHLKLAMSLDGRIATRARDSHWVTGEEARAAAQAMRHEYDAIAVGINTVLTDNPQLTDRSGRPRHRPLVRVVFDTSLRLPDASSLAQTVKESGPVIAFAARDGAKLADIERLTTAGVEVVAVQTEDGRAELGQCLDELGHRRITSLLVEGGGELAASFLNQRLADKVTFFYAPRIIGGRDAIAGVGGTGITMMSDAIQLAAVEIIRRGDDWEVTGYPLYPSVSH
jgi:diaminohydroxyphosphoribosylaminopyrimidine deaminase/5-amino-6-(5-phosphoribosylamino)uracil reductase